MGSVFILVDSSTRGSRSSKYGESTACWGVFLDDIEGMPCRDLPPDIVTHAK